MHYRTNKYNKLFILILVVVLICCTSACGRSYQVDIVGDAGGSVSAHGRSMTGFFEISGTSTVYGKYYRHTNLNVNDVVMKESISADKGVLETTERTVMASEAITNPKCELVKFPGSQTYSVTVHEMWPLILNTERSMDYVGRRISDREAFGNNLDYVDTSHLYNTDFRKYRTCRLYLNDTWFIGNVTDDPEEVAFLPKNQFLPEKSTSYRIESLSNGLATLKYRQVADDYSIADEGLETYAGTFRIGRRIYMGTEGKNESKVEFDWLECCLSNINTSQKMKVNCAS